MRLKYFLTIDTITNQVTPYGISDFGIEYSKPDDRRFSYLAKATKSILLKGSDFTFVYDYETNVKRCQTAYFDVHFACGTSNDYSLYRRYAVKMNRCTFDLDKCVVEIPISLENDYSCYDNNKKIKIDLLDAVEDVYTANIYRGTLEFVEYTSAVLRDFFKDSEFPEPDSEHKGWMLYEYSKDSGIYTYKYAREKLTVPCSEDIDESWIILESCDGSVKVIVRPVPTYYRINAGTDLGARPPRQGDIFDRYYEGRLFTSFVVGYTADSSYTTMDNGMLLSDVLQAIATATCGKTIKSNFLQVNPDGPFETIYPNLRPVKTENIMVFAKSDIKRPNATSNASVANATPEKFINDLCNKLNCGFIIDANFIQIEHISFFGRALGLDSLLPKHARGMMQSSKYSYIEGELPELEIFEDVESYNFDFVGVPIRYKDDCAVKGHETKVTMEYITTDMEWVLTGGVRDADYNDNGKISEDGFVLASMEKIGSDYYFLRELPILDDYMRLNNPFAWAQLHRDFFKHDRPQLAGEMNNVYTQFLTSRPIKKGQSFDIAFCCDDVFKLTDYVNTVLGSAIVSSAVYNLISDKLTIEPLYEQPTIAFVCLGTTSFVLLRFEDSKFYFSVSYAADANPKDIQVEILDSTGNHVDTIELPATAPGEFFIDMSSYPEGSYKFRVRVDCGDGEFSPWSTEVSGTFTTCSETISADIFTFIAFYATASSVPPVHPRGFKFSYPRTDPLPPSSFEVEVTRPDGAVFIFDGIIAGASGANWIFYVYPEIPPFVNGPNSGLYKFRFRYICSFDQKGPWSVTYKNVTI